jgi:hypothetical protein
MRGVSRCRSPESQVHKDLALRLLEISAPALEMGRPARWGRRALPIDGEL